MINQLVIFLRKKRGLPALILLCIIQTALLWGFILLRVYPLFSIGMLIGFALCVAFGGKNVARFGCGVPFSICLRRFYVMGTDNFWHNYWTGKYTNGKIPTLEQGGLSNHQF